MRRDAYGLLAAGIISILASTGALAADPADTCEAGKNGTAGKYAACLHKAQAKFVKGGSVDTATRDAALVKCSEKYSGKWQSSEDKAGGACPSNGDETGVQDFLDACAMSVQDALGGGALPLNVVTCNGNLGTCNTNLTTCSGNLSSTNADLGTCNGNLGTCTTNLATCSGDLATASSGTAAVGDVLAGKTFTSTAGLGATGTMPNNGAVTLTPTTSDQAIAAGYHDGSGRCSGDADLVAGNIKSGVNLFGVAGTLPSGGVVKTGQTICYNASGSVIACAGTGHDGELQKGVAASFTDNGDGTVTDNLTGLMWEKLSDDGSIHDKDNTYTWNNAFASKVATLNSGSFAGYNDWRVPSVRELQTLVSFGALNPSTYSAFNTGCVAACTVTTCSCTRTGDYWSSSTYELVPTAAWFVNLTVGYTSVVSKGGFDNYVRAVRAGF